MKLDFVGTVDGPGNKMPECPKDHLFLVMASAGKEGVRIAVNKTAMEGVPYKQAEQLVEGIRDAIQEAWAGENHRSNGATQ